MSDQKKLQLLIKAPKQGAGLGIMAEGERPITESWHLKEHDSAAVNPGEAWDIAYEVASQRKLFAEPNFDQPYRWDRGKSPSALAARPGEAGRYEDQAAGFPKGNGFAWHLGDDFTQLAKARDEIEKLTGQGKLCPIRIGIIDVGFDFKHRALPAGPQLRLDLQRNFADGEPNDASDPYIEGLLHQDQPGHGTGTMSILAGRKLVNMLRPEQEGIVLGGNPFAEIIPCRIGPTVVLAKTAAFVEAVQYLMAPNGDPNLRADVISMSMGGLASEAWADVVNAAYEAGIFMVTAAGNNFGAPKAIVYPARFNRVVAACGVMADGSPYIAGLGTMSGNFGPDGKMETALASYTPNVPWAQVNAEDIVDMNGSGTSAATPQIAAAAALWLNKYKSAAQKRYNGRDAGWNTVEAVRNALFKSARRPDPVLFKYFGNGILQAFDALRVAPLANPVLTPRDAASREFFHLFEKPFGMAPAADPQDPLERMLNLELTQLFQRDGNLEQIVSDPSAEIDPGARSRLLEAVAQSQFASNTLRERSRRALAMTGGSGAKAGAASSDPAPTIPRQQNQTIRTRVPQVRRLRAYGFDPSLSTRLETMRLNQMTMEIPWERPLRAGPVGEYLEVVDHDPATGCFYAPVDLNDRYLLASDGLPPSEGNPQFHQQMVYAVAMRTIANFETALGRKAFWASRKDDGSGYVQRLRIYPHGLRAQNAYYHPGKKALLFGYFPAESGDPNHILPGGVVFTCLSHDVVAHETTHALLDGMHRRFNHPSNPDLLAFHEAFADIVAVFQHFSIPGALEARIAEVGGDLRTDELMGDLAQEFGRGAGLHESLRTALTPDAGKDSETADKRIYEVWEPHDRGAILLGAVFEAFIRIYEHRSRDLIRIATGGQGRLLPGPVNHDLAVRLAGEAAASAQHVLNMCIRALDYCPVVDLNFGDFLRAIITADVAMVPNDDKGYRVAFLEAFRARGIYPQGVRSMSVDSLLWRAPEDGEGQAGPGLLERFELVDLVRDFSDKYKRFYTRGAMHGYAGQVRRKDFKPKLEKIAPQDKQLLGLDPALEFDVSALHLSEKQGQYGRVVPQLILSIAQKKSVALFEDGTGPEMLFEGGATLIIDPQYLRVDYVISKNIQSQDRLKLQRRYLQDPRRSLRDLYFGDDPNQRFAMLHKLVL
jgi:hypothetical protein